MTCPQCGTLNVNTSEECVRCKTKLRSPEMVGKIACVNHGNREATTSCAACGNRLCDACAVNANGVDFCEAHAPASAVRAHDEDYERVPVLDAAHAAGAGFGLRLLAFVVDGLLLFAAAMVIALVFWLLFQSLDFLSPQTHPVAFWLYWSLLLLGGGAYFIVLTAMNGRTLGKQVAGVIVLGRDGRPIPLGASVVRFAVAAVSALPFGLGFLWALWDKNGETWHDKAARTRVFRWEETA